MEAIIIIVCIIIFVLNICLFFKLWGLCNNVAKFSDKLAKKLDNSPDGTTEAPFHIELKHQGSEQVNEQCSTDVISQDEIQKRLRIKEIIERIQNGAVVKKEWVQLLIDRPQVAIIEPLVELYIEVYHGKRLTSNAEIVDECSFIEKILSSYPRKDVIDIVYKNAEVLKNSAMISLIKTCKLFDARKIFELCKTDAHNAVEMLGCDAPMYSAQDITIMKKIADWFDKMPDTGMYENGKLGVFGKEEELFICQNGHKNKKDSEFCGYCGLNIKGYTNDEIDIINSFKDKIDVLTQQDK